MKVTICKVDNISRFLLTREIREEEMVECPKCGNLDIVYVNGECECDRCGAHLTLEIHDILEPKQE